MKHWTEIIPAEAAFLLDGPLVTRGQQQRFCEVLIEYYDGVSKEHPEESEAAIAAKGMWEKQLNGILTVEERRSKK